MWSDRSLERLGGVDPRLLEVMKRAREISGVPFEVSEGMRSADRQEELVSQGKSQTMNSRHLHGNAIDVHTPDGEGGVNWDFESYRPIADAAKQAATELGYSDFVWGGDWNTLKDGVHFQIGGAGKQPKGLLASSTMNTTESEMVPEQKPKGLLGGLFSDPDKRARLAMALEGMTLNPNKGMMASLQSGIQQRGEDKKEAAAEAKKLAQTNKSLEFLASQPGGEDYVRLAEAAGVPTAMKAYLENKKAPKSTAAEGRISRLMSTGVPENIAIGIVDGRYVVKTNDITGETFVLDVSTGQKVFGATGAGGNEVPVDQPAPTASGGAFEDKDPNRSTGARGLANSWLNIAADTLGFGLPAPQAAEAAATMKTLAARTISLADTEFEGKATDFLRKQVEENFTIKPNQISLGSQGALIKANEMIRMLEETVRGAESVANGTTSTVQARKRAMDNLPTTKLLLRDYISLRDALQGAQSTEPVKYQATPIQNNLLDLYAPEKG